MARINDYISCAYFYEVLFWMQASLKGKRSFYNIKPSIAFVGPTAAFDACYTYLGSVAAVADAGVAAEPETTNAGVVVDELALTVALGG